VPCRGTEVPRSSFGGSVLSRVSRASLPPARPFAGSAPSRRSRVVPGPAGSPLLGFLLPRTQLRRVPLLRHALPRGRTCGTRIARPSSVPSSGFSPLSTVPASTRLARGLLDPAVRRGPRRFAAFFHAARVPGAPLQSFPFPGSRTRSRGPPASLRVRSPTAAGAAPAGDSRALSRTASALCRSRPPEGGPGTHEPGRSFLALASPVASTHTGCAARAVHFLPTLGSPVNGRHARFEALLPPGVRSATTPSPGQAEAARRCSPGVLALQSSLHYGSGFGLSRQHTWGARSPSATCTAGRPAVAVACRDPDSDA
jgi:hypothetical protein